MVDDVAEQTWDLRERPILEAVYLAEETGDQSLDLETIASGTGLDEQTASRAVRSLYEGGYLTGADASTLDGFDLLDIRLLPKARRAIGQWPSDDAFQSLMGLLEAQIAAEPDAARKTKLEYMRDVVRDVGVDVAGGVLGALLKQAAGLV